MTVVYIISFLLIAFGIVRILGLTPESIGADVSSILDRKKSLRDNAMRARGKKRTNKLVLWLDKIRRALSDAEQLMVQQKQEMRSESPLRLMPDMHFPTIRILL